MILIGTPTRDLLYSGFTFDLVQLMAVSPEAKFCILQGTYLPNLRTEFVNVAIRLGASHILFIDSDMRFPAEALNSLLERNVEVVGANCKQRTQNEYTARKNGKFMSSKGKKGIEEVDSLGFGVTLLSMSVFERLPLDCFGMPFDGHKFVGEDVNFCQQVKEAGIKIYVDHDLSQNVKHAGLVEFGI